MVEHATPASIHALLIEDNPGDARLIREMLRDARGGRLVQVQHADRLAAGLDHLTSAEGGPVDVVLLDLTLPDSSGFDTFSRLRAEAPVVPIVVLSGLDDETLALRAVQEGAQDYLVKGHVDGDTLLRAMRYAIERKRLEEAQRELERQKDEFFSNVSHDLRTPVAAIKASIEVVLAAPPSGITPTQLRLLNNVSLAADELAQLVENLLDVSRLQAGRVELFRTRVDLVDLVRRAARSVEPLILARHQSLEIDVPETPVRASVDAERVVRVLVNLLSNANKYGRAGGRIALDLQHGTEEILIAVKDDGSGIRPGDLERIFERFYRSGSNSQAAPGFGLGLGIARGFVELHGGRLWAESPGLEGRGAALFLALPIDRS